MQRATSDHNYRARRRGWFIAPTPSTVLRDRGRNYDAAPLAPNESWLLRKYDGQHPTHRWSIEQFSDNPSDGQSERIHPRAVYLYPSHAPWARQAAVEVEPPFWIS